ncbi:MAG: aldehyde dehydrogenase (NADP(+)), partial [Sphingomicrobium sp.]
DAATPQTMLTAGIHKAYEDGIARLAENADVTTVARGTKSDGGQCGQAAIFAVDAPAFLAERSIAEEVFGASSLVVRCADEAELATVIASLEGQLTATLQFDEADTLMASRLMPHLEAKVGRLLANAWPTGVEVAHAMLHGGPFPATSDGRSTSVGSLAINRFLRPICYQDIPDALLPPELRNDGDALAPRRIDGKLVAGGQG